MKALDELFEYLVAGFLFLLLVPTLAGVGYGIYAELNAPRLTGTVASIGGCDRYGRCGALLESGESCVISYPVVGQRAECRR